MNTRIVSERDTTRDAQRAKQDRLARWREAAAAALVDVVADPASGVTGAHIVAADTRLAKAVATAAAERGLAADPVAAAGDSPASRASRPSHSVTVRAPQSQQRAAAGSRTGAPVRR